MTTHLLATALASVYPRVEVLTITPLGEHREPQADYVVRRLGSILDLMRCLRGSDLVILKGGMSLPAGIAASFMGKPVLIWHEMDGSLVKGFPFWKRLLVWPFTRSLIASALHVAVSKACLESKSLPSACRKAVIYNPVSPELEEQADSVRHSPAPKSKLWDLLFVGRFVEWKGVAVLVEALDLLDAQGLELSVAFVGEGPLEPLITSHSSRWRKIKAGLPGVLPHTELGAAYAASRIVVFPSIWPEGMGMVPVEAMAFGLPVIAANHKALVEVAGGAGLFVAPGDPEELAGAIKKIITDGVLFERLSANAFVRSAEFRFARFSTSVVELVNGIQKTSIAA